MTFKSLGRFRRRNRIPGAEALVCLFSPILAVLLRGIDFSDPVLQVPVAAYIGASILGGLASVYYVQISRAASGFVSTVDLIKIFKSALITSVTGVIATYFLTHMQGVPRYVPIIHFFLFSGCLTVLTARRAGLRVQAALRQFYTDEKKGKIENQLLLGCGPSAVHYAALIDELPNLQKNVVGIVSICGDLTGSTLGARTVLGPIDNIVEIITEFKNHGVEIHRLVIAAADEENRIKAFDAVGPYCDAHSIPVSFLSDLMTGRPDRLSESSVNARMEMDGGVAERTDGSPLSISPYLLARQKYEAAIAVLLACLLSPMMIFTSFAVYLDVGSPVIFWQRRVGRYGRTMTVHKFRTLPHRGNSLQADQRAPSRIGRFLQLSRLDELPQILDIIRGELSFIGPRPLLPQDLPSETGLRENVLPGITGWAQVHGGKQITPIEKVALDQWYLKNASPMIDALILMKTLRVAFSQFDRRDDAAIDAAVKAYAGATVEASPSKLSHSEARPAAVLQPTALHDALVNQPTRREVL